jgi:hypothetical protein
LEQRYRRLLALYPRDHRERNGEEMLGVLVAAAGERATPGWRDTADLLWGAFRLHLRRLVAADGAIPTKDVLAIVSLLGPVVLLAGAANALREVMWWVSHGALADMSWRQIPDAPLWGVWLVVAALALFGPRRLAAGVAWLGVAAFVPVAYYWEPLMWWDGPDGGWILLGVVTAAALTWSPGPARGRELVGTRGIVLAMAAVVAAIGINSTGRSPVVTWWWATAVAIGVVLACGAGSRVGRRAALVLAVPVLTVLLDSLVMFNLGRLPTVATIPVYYGVPLLLILASGGLPRRFGRRPVVERAGSDVA